MSTNNDSKTRENAGVRNVTIPIALLDAHSRNYRSHPERQIARLGASIQRFSQVRSIVVKAQPNGRYTILAGHGITEAARRAGMTEMRCDVVPDDWDDLQCMAYLAADNMGGADDDLALLAEMLQEQANAGEALETLGYDADELTALLSQLADDADPAFGPASEDEQGRLDEKAQVECPHCGHRFTP